MKSESLRSVLQESGLSPYEADAYVALLRAGSASASEVAEASDVPKPRVYDVLDSLESEGYIETYQQDSLRARVHDPDGAISDLETHIAQFEAATEEIEERWNRPAMEQNEVSIVSRLGTVFARAEAIIAEAEYHVQLSVTATQFRELRPLLADATERGVAVQVSVHTDTDESLDLDETAFEGACTEVRHRAIPAPFVVLVDRKRVCFAPHALAAEEYGVLVDDRMLTYVFHWFFLTCLWEVWDPVYTARGGEPPTQFVEIRECIRTVESLLEEGTAVDVEIDGRDTETGGDRHLRGTVTEVRYSDDSREGSPSLLQLAGRATLVVRTDDGEVTVGGQGALLEDVAANRITIREITERG